MRNYVKEMELAAKKRDLPIFFPATLSMAYFLGYSALIFLYNQKYYEIFLSLSIPLAFAVMGFELSRMLPSDNEMELQNEIKEARKFLEKSSGKADSEGINALVDLYRSRKGENKWNSIDDMLLEAFPDKGELREAITGILEGGK